MGKKNRRKGGNLLGTAFKFIRIGALIGPAIPTYQYGGGGLSGVAEALVSYGGYSIRRRQFSGKLLVSMWIPYLGAVLMTKAIPKISGIIRRL